MSTGFNFYVGIDYSGAAFPQTRTSSLQVYLAEGSNLPARVQSPACTKNLKRNWNRLEVYAWLSKFLQRHDSVIVGIDHGFSFPKSYFKRYKLETWDQFLTDFVESWPTHEAGTTIEQFRADSKRTGNAKELRLTERWTSSAKSVFQFDVQGSVAKSTHAGIPFLLQLRKAFPLLHFWPFDGFEVSQGQSVVAEIYPSIFRNRYLRDSRTVDQQDAYSVCRWMQEMDRHFGMDRYFQPPLSESELSIAALEGWILGVS